MAETSSGLVMVRQAALALNGFPPEDQARIRSTLGHLLGPSAIEELGSRVHSLDSNAPLYSVGVPPDILVIFARRGETIAILDFVRRGALKTFASGSARAQSEGQRSGKRDRPLPSEAGDVRRRKKVPRATR